MSQSSEDAPRLPIGGIEGAISRLTAYVDAIKREKDAAKVLSEAETRQGFFFGISGRDLSLQGNGVRIESSSSLVQISRVTSPPSHEALTEALDPKQAGGAIFFANLFQQVNFELYISERMAYEVEDAIVLSKHLLNILRVRTGCLLRVVAMAATPWDQMAACERNLMVVVHPFGLNMGHGTLWTSEKYLSCEDLDWALLRTPRCQKLYKGEPSFRLAIDAASESPFIGDARTAIARIWSGIESLFDVATELSYRLSMYVAVLVSDDVQARISIQRDFKKLYGLRSKAVHGAKMSEETLLDALVESWAMLCTLLNACIQMSSTVPDTATLDSALLGVPLERDSGIE